STVGMFDDEGFISECVRKLGAQERVELCHAHSGCLRQAGTFDALFDRLEITVPSQPALEAASASYAVRDQGLAAIVPFLNQGVAHSKPMALDGGAPVCPNAHLRKARNFVRALLRLGASASLGSDVFAQADTQTFLRRHLSSGEDDLQSASLADDPRQ